MKPAGMGWLKDIGLTEEELAKAQSNFVPIETVENKPGVEPIVVKVGKYDGGNADVAKYGGYAPSRASNAVHGASQGAMTGYKKPDLESEAIEGQIRDLRDARTVATSGAATGMEEPAEGIASNAAATAKALGLQQDELKRAAHSDNVHRFIDAIGQSGRMANAAFGGEPFREVLPSGVYNEADKARSRLAASKDFDLRTQGAEAKAANWERRALIGEEGIRLGDRKIGAANERAKKANETLLLKTEEVTNAQKEIADMKAQADAEEAEADRLARIKIAGMKGRKGGGAPGAAASNKGLHNSYEFDEGANKANSFALNKHNEAVVSKDAITGVTKEMRGILKDANLWERYGPTTTSAILDSLENAAMLEGKDVAGLGALTGPDMKIMDAVKGGNSTALKDSFKDMGRILDNLDSWAQRRVDARSAAVGAHLKKKPGADSPMQETVKIRRKSDGVIKAVSAEVAEQLLKKPKYERAP